MSQVKGEVIRQRQDRKCPWAAILIGLYRENAIAIESEARYPFGGNVYYVTMQITFLIPEFRVKNVICIVT